MSVLSAQQTLSSGMRSLDGLASAANGSFEPKVTDAARCTNVGFPKIETDR